MASGMSFFRLCLQPCSSSSARFSFLDVSSNNNSSPFLTRKRVLLQHEEHRYRSIPPMRASRGGSAAASAHLKKSNAQSEESTKTGVTTRRAIVTLIALSTQAFAAASLSSRAEPTESELMRIEMLQRIQERRKKSPPVVMQDAPRLEIPSPPAVVELPPQASSLPSPPPPPETETVKKPSSILSKPLADVGGEDTVLQQDIAKQSNSQQPGQQSQIQVEAGEYDVAKALNSVGGVGGAMLGILLLREREAKKSSDSALKDVKAKLKETQDVMVAQRDQLEGTLLAGMYLPLLSKSICNVSIHVPSSLSKKNCNCALLQVVERTCLLLTQRRSRP
jgi:hypothetical protein